jgi:hypothetical protein
MGIVSVVAVAYLLSHWITSDPKLDAIILLDKLPEYSGCIEGDMMFERNVPVTMVVSIHSNQGFVRHDIPVRIDTEWGVHNDQVVPMWRPGMRHAELYIYWNEHSRVVPHKLYHFKICGFSEVAPDKQANLLPRANNAKIIFQ